jgi:hypothetical protein
MQECKWSIRPFEGKAKGDLYAIDQYAGAKRLKDGRDLNSPENPDWLALDKSGMLKNI